MKPEILSLRVSRRAIGVAVLRSDGLALSDGRHLPSVASRAVAATTRYVERLMKSSLIAVVLDAPRRGVSAATDAVLDSIIAILRSRGLSPLLVEKAEVLAAYGVSPLRTRGEVRQLVLDYWPDLQRVRGEIQRYTVDAAAAALYAECQVAFNQSP
jgi:hypothetical protein